MVIDSLFQKRSQNLPIYLQADVPPPSIVKVEAGQGDILVLADVPPNDKVGFCFCLMYPPNDKVGFWFWLMYPPPQNDKVGFQVKVTF